MAETSLTAHEAKCILTALLWGDPAIVNQADPDLQEAKRKLRLLVSAGGDRTDDPTRPSPDVLVSCPSECKRHPARHRPPCSHFAALDDQHQAHAFDERQKP